MAGFGRLVPGPVKDRSAALSVRSDESSRVINNLKAVVKEATEPGQSRR